MPPDKDENSEEDVAGAVRVVGTVDVCEPYAASFSIKAAFPSFE